MVGFAGEAKASKALLCAVEDQVGSVGQGGHAGDDTFGGLEVGIISQIVGREGERRLGGYYLPYAQWSSLIRRLRVGSIRSCRVRSLGTGWSHRR